jgi:hypothetical protein
MVDFYSIIPVIVFVTVFVGLAVYIFMLWLRAHSKPCDGRQMGPYELRGRIGDGRLFDPYFGNLAEVTDWFFVTAVKKAFDSNIIPAIRNRITELSDQKEKENLEAALKTLSNLFLKETRRI